MIIANSKVTNTCKWLTVCICKYWRIVDGLHHIYTLPRLMRLIWPLAILYNFSNIPQNIKQLLTSCRSWEVVQGDASCWNLSFRLRKLVFSKRKVAENSSHSLLKYYHKRQLNIKMWFATNNPVVNKFQSFDITFNRESLTQFMLCNTEIMDTCKVVIL